jgi:biotin transport system substrate-specific component
MNNAHILKNYRSSDNHVIAAGEIVLTATLIAVCAQIKIPLPWTEIPLTMQTLPVLAMPFVVGRDRAFGGVLAFLALGAIQMPVFAVTTGATIGFLVAFALAPFVVTRFSPALGMLLATLLIYAMGTAWYCVFKGVMPWTALMLTVIPFIPGDIAKAAAAYATAKQALRGTKDDSR